LVITERDLRERIDEIVLTLRDCRDQKRLETVYRTGKLVVEVLFGGDVQGWRNRTKGEPSYLWLEAHPNLPISQAELYRSLRVYELCERISHVLTSKLLTLSHVMAVLSLGPEVQQKLLLTAETLEWTVRRLRREVESIPVPPPSTGRPRNPQVIRTLRGALASEHAFDGSDALLGLDRRSARTLLEVCTRAQAELKGVERLLKHAASDRPRARVLLVDGSPGFAYRAQQQLRRHGCAVRLAHSAAEALAQIQPDTLCAVIELFLPDGCGVELSMRLKQEHAQLRCIFVTSQRKDLLPEVLRDVEPLVYKSSGLSPLRVALAKTLAEAQLVA
jgi:CheY-like chemotaxis protein